VPDLVNILNVEFGSCNMCGTAWAGGTIENYEL
jgi:hypothetical protein